MTKEMFLKISLPPEKLNLLHSFVDSGANKSEEKFFLQGGEVHAHAEFVVFLKSNLQDSGEYLVQLKVLVSQRVSKDPDNLSGFTELPIPESCLLGLMRTIGVLK